MRKGWEYKSFTKVCDVTYGYAFDSKCFTDNPEDTPLIRIRDVKRGFSETFYNGEIPDGYKVMEGDYLVGMDGEFNIGQWGKRPGVLNQRVCKMNSSSSELINQYMYYFMKVCLKSIEDETPFVTVKHLSAKRINQIQIPLPPLSTQLAIVSELDKINELIRLKKEQLKDFDNLAQSLFYEMFGEGKCMRKKLKDIVKIQSGQVSPLEEPYSEMIHVGPANIESNTGRLLNLKTAKEENLISGKYLFNSSMVLYSKIRPNLNKVTIPSFEGICSADMYPIIPLECIDKNFLLFLLKQKEFLTYAISNSGRANIPKINREALLNYEAILPPLSLQRLFAQRIEQIEREKSEVQKSILDLETLLASRMQYWFE